MTDAGRLEYKDLAQLTAVPATNYQFVNWTYEETGETVSAENPYTIPEDKKGNMSLVANFIPTCKITSKNVSGIEHGKLYQFRVRAVAGKEKGAWSKATKRYMKKLKDISAAKGRKSGSVFVKWKADSKATGGYTVLVRTSKDGAVLAKLTVAAGKTSATVKGLEPGRRVWVQVRPLRAADGKVYVGILRSHAKYVKCMSALSNSV